MGKEPLKKSPESGMGSWEPEQRQRGTESEE